MVLGVIIQIKCISGLIRTCTNAEELELLASHMLELNSMLDDEFNKIAN